MYRLIALDIDDTITLNPRVVPNEIIEAVRKAKEHGIHVTVATGRGWWGSKLIIDQLDITDPVINYGGAMVTDPGSGTLNIIPRNEKAAPICTPMRYRRSSLRRFSGRRRHLVYTPISIRVTR